MGKKLCDSDKKNNKEARGKKFVCDSCKRKSDEKEKLCKPSKR